MSKNIYQRLSEQRKLLQENGHLPEWITTPSYQMLKDKYLLEGESLKSRFHEISSAAASHLPHPIDLKYKKIFFDLMWKGWLSCSTPILSSMGRREYMGSPVACSGQYVEDSIASFYENQVEAALLTKNGFGTSVYLGDIRPRGSKINNSRGTASGILPVLKDFTQVATDVSQSNRRGAIACYIPIDHKDVPEIINYVERNPDNINIGWCIPSDFIDKLNSSDEDSLSLYQRILKLKMLTGKGYFHFTDKVNEANPQWYKDKNVDVKASNLCVAPETLLLTSSGYEVISDLVNERVTVWNGREWSESIVRKTGSNKKLLTVTLSDTTTIDCTPYHRFAIQRFTDTGHYAKSGTYDIVEARNIKEGDKLIKFQLPIIEGTEEFANAYENGFHSGDGCDYKGVQIVYFYGKKRELTGYFKHLIGTWSIQENQDREVFRTRELQFKYTVPTASHTIESRLNWLAGICDSDGVLLINKSSQSIQIGSSNLQFMKDIKLMLQTLGIHSYISIGRVDGINLLPANDGTGELKEFNTRQAYRLCIASGGIYNLLNLGLACRRLNLQSIVTQRDAIRFVKVVRVEDLGRVDDTFCLTEKNRGMVMFNGHLTLNCDEVTLPSSDTESFTCVLSAMNLAKYDEWKDTSAMFDSTVFLHCVALEFLKVSEGIKGLEKAREFTKNHMALGLGVMGFHTLVQSKDLIFGSVETHLLNTEIFKKLSHQTLTASKYLVTMFGECPITEGYGVANAHLTAVSPTLSTALIMGGVSNGIEPLYSNAYIQNTAAGKVTRVNPYILKIAKEKGIDTESLTKELINNGGSTQKLTWLTDHQKAVTKTAFEINQEDILRLASVRQKYITQGQSINLFFPADESEEEISRIHKIAFIDKYIKGLYYIRSTTGIQAKDREVVCEACAS